MTIKKKLDTEINDLSERLFNFVDDLRLAITNKEEQNKEKISKLY